MTRHVVVAMSALAIAQLSYAGDYHRGADLRCSQCHAMHASRQHQLARAGADTTYPLELQGTGHEKLLMLDGVNETCLQCHDGAHYPDVFGADTAGNDTYLTTGSLRSAGALNGTVAARTLGTTLDADGATVTYASWMGHSLGATTNPPGFIGTYAFSAEGFTCADCHAVHGSAGFRNAGGSRDVGVFPRDDTNPFRLAYATYTAAGTVGAINAAYDVTVDTVRDYKTPAVRFGQGSGNVNGAGGMNRFCAVCHGQFHGSTNTDPDGDGHFIRHPTTGVLREGGLLTASYDGMSTAQTDLVRPSWVDPNTFEVGCLTCHKAHGNARGFALVYPSNLGAVVDYENGDALKIDTGSTRAYYPIRNLCVTCHPMGRD